jgi:hypothetical protein
MALVSINPLQAFVSSVFFFTSLLLISGFSDVKGGISVGCHGNHTILMQSHFLSIPRLCYIFGDCNPQKLYIYGDLKFELNLISRIDVCKNNIRSTEKAVFLKEKP